MATAVLPVRPYWTVEDLQALDVEDWRRFEIVDGALVVSPTPDIGHEFVISRLRRIVERQTSDEFVILGYAGVEIGRSYRVPDLTVVHESIREVRRGSVLPADVILAVEVVSPGSVTTDRITKPAQYAAAGIASFWRVETDPVSLSAFRLEPGASSYTEIGTWRGDEVAALSEPFPVQIALASLV